MTSVRARIGAACLAALGAAALLAPWLPLRDPSAQPDALVLRDLPPLARAVEIRLADGRALLASEARALPDGGVEYRRAERWTRIGARDLAGPAAGGWLRRPLYVLGTDGFGRDLLSRIVHGARVSLAVGLLAALLAVAIGGGVGLAAGIGGRRIDGALMRLTDLVLSIPRLFLLGLLVALWGPSLATTIGVLGATTWMAAARAVRGEILSLRERDFVRAAAASGASPVRIAARHLLPGVAGPLLAEGALRLGDALLLEAALSFLGLGVPPPTPSWGNCIADGRHSLLDAWWIATLPGLAIATTVVAAGLVGEALAERPGSRTRPLQEESRARAETRAAVA